MSASENDNIIVVGPMGVGKTTVGRFVSDLLGRKFIDTDSLIEEMTGLSIARIFSERSEAYFRSLEREVVQKISAESDIVIAAGRRDDSSGGELQRSLCEWDVNLSYGFG